MQEMIKHETVFRTLARDPACSYLVHSSGWQSSVPAMLNGIVAAAVVTLGS